RSVVGAAAQANVALQAVFGAAIQAANLMFDDGADKDEQDQTAQADGEEDEVMGEQPKDDQTDQQGDDGHEGGETADNPANPAARLVFLRRATSGRAGRERGGGTAPRHIGGWRA